MPPREQGFPYANGPMMTVMPSQYKNPAAGAQNTAGDGKPVSFLNWLGTYGMVFIPIAGWLIFLVMLFVWAFGANAPASKKNWARATLIFIGVSIIIMIIYLAAFLPVYMNMYQDMMNGTFDFNNYYNGLSN
jgi:heme/copper-type cytochrome/quinol oxidase subunit 2